MTAFAIDVDAYDAMNMVQFERAQLEGPNLARFLRNRAVPWFQQRTSTRFSHEGGSEVGGPWAQLQPTTQVIRATSGFPPAHPINVRTGNLRDWITNAPGNTNTYAYGTKLTWPEAPPAGGELANKYKVAQLGGKVRVGRGQYRGVRPRPVVGVDNNDLQYLLSGLRQWLKVL